MKSKPVVSGKKRVGVKNPPITPVKPVGYVSSFGVNGSRKQVAIKGGEPKKNVDRGVGNVSPVGKVGQAGMDKRRGFSKESRAYLNTLRNKRVY